MKKYRQVTTHKIFVKEDEIKHNFYFNSVDSLKYLVAKNNKSGSEITEFEIGLRGFYEDYIRFTREGFNYLFSTGCTMQLLDEEEFNHVVEFFEFKLAEKGEELQIIIELNNGQKEIVTHENIKY